MGNLFNIILYQPIFNALFYIYHVIPGHDLGVAIIILTLIIRLLLFWPSLSGLKAQKKLQDTQPKIEAIKKKYKDNKEELGKQLMKFYQENKINPFSSCLPLLIQLPILIALYRVFLHGLQFDAQTHLLVPDQLNFLYGYLKNIFATQPVEVTFFGIIDLAATKNIVLAVLAGLAQFVSAKMLSLKKAEVKSKGAQDENMAAMMNKQMLYFMPILTVIFGYQLPAGITLYWLVSTVFTLGQQYLFLRIKKKDANQLQPTQ